MKKILSVLLFIFAVMTVLGQDQAKNRAVEAIIRREMKERRIPGLQIAIMQHGRIVFSEAFGTADLQQGTPVDRQTVFAINSCTKVFTSVALMQLVEVGKINLSSPVSTYLDSLPDAWQQVTIRQLLTHTSGFPDLLKLLDPVTGGLGVLKTEQALWQKLITQPMDFQPGARFSYNQTNAYLLGKLIDKYAGAPFASVFAEKQFRIAGMSHTSFGDSRDVIPHFAPTYFYRNQLDGRPLGKDSLINNYYEFPYFRRTASGLNSTAEDMAHWLIALQQGKLVKSKALRDTMWSKARFNNGQPTSWALGWGISKQRMKHRAVGMSGGGRSAFLLYPDDDLAVIVLTNLGGSYPEDFLEEIAGCYEPGIISADPITFIRTNLQKKGFDQAIPLVQEQMHKDPAFKPDEFELNEWGYRLLAKGQLAAAVAIFKLNVTLFPDSWNAADSYGEALLKSGNRPGAIEQYRRSVALNSDNTHGKQVLEKIQH